MPTFTVEKRTDGNNTRWKFIKADNAIIAVILDNKFAPAKERRLINIFKYKYNQEAISKAKGEIYKWAVIKEPISRKTLAVLDESMQNLSKGKVGGKINAKLSKESVH